MRGCLVTLGLVAAVLWAGAARAILIDPYDNVLAPDGYYGLAYFNYYQADELTGADGNKAANIDLTATVGILRPLTYFHIGRVPMAFQVIVPFGKLEETKLLDEDSSGLGDIVFGPGIFLYASDESATYLSYWFYVFSPTGEWNEDQVINLGQHHWYFEHQLAVNQILGKFVFDMNLNLYHHLEEPDTDVTLPLRFELETSLAYQVTERLVAGVNWGGYWDLGEAEVNGDSIPGTKLKRFNQFGPSIGYQATDRLGFNFRWTHDFSVANDTKGDDVWLRASYAF